MTLLRPALLIGLLTFSFVPPCAAQKTIATNVPKQINFDLQTPYGQRTDAFRRLLSEFRFQPLNDFGQLQAHPEEAILIVLGDPSCLSKAHFPRGLREFVKQGGAVLIATDKETDGEAGLLLAELAGVRVPGETLVCLGPQDTDVYDKSKYCPFVQPASASPAILDTLVNAGGRPDLFRNPHPHRPPLRVATNAPSHLRTTGLFLPGGIHRLAYLPSSCEDEAEMGFALPQVKSESAARPLFAVGGTRGKGRVLVLADHSIFINRMLLPGDNGNLEFTANCLHWLRGGAATSTELLRAANSPHAVEDVIGRRNKVLLWNDGSIQHDFQVPLQTVPIKPSFDMSPALVAALDRAVGRMEDSDFFNRKLREKIEELPGGSPRVARDALLALTLAAALLLGYLFLWRGRHRSELAAPLLMHAINQHEPRTSLLEQRRHALLRSGNVWEMAHHLARQYFESADILLTGDSPPRLVVEGNWWRRRRAGQRMARLWKLARGDAPARLSRSALKIWLRDLEALKTDLANGTIQRT